jgi:enoyl-CoA hydratase/carnithine racemase
MFTKLSEYKDKYKHIAFTREDGILVMRFHTDGGPFQWSAMPDGPQHTAGAAFYDVGHDPETKIVIITGTGDRWCTGYGPPSDYPEQDGVTPLWWDALYRAERDLFFNLLHIPVPVIGVVPGPASYHPEILLLSDVVLAAPETYFADDSHISVGVVPGDGIQIVWEMLIGPNRTRAMQYLNQRIEAEEALRLGIVAELHPRDKLMARAMEVARDLIARCTPVTLRSARLTMTENIRRRIATEHAGSYALEGLAQVMRPQLAKEPDVEVWRRDHPKAGTIKVGHD